MRNCFLILFFLSVGFAVRAQVVNFNMSNSTQTVPCSGTFNFYDSGGAAGNYMNNESYTVTFYPSTPGQCIQINFSAFGTESCCDFFRAYDGPNAASPLLGTYSGAATPPSISSTGGPMTVVFTSDFSVVGSGWAAVVSCVACPPPPAYYLMNSTNVTLTCPPTFSLFYDSGGPSGNYNNNENFTKTFTAPAGFCLRFEFGSFSTESCCDRLRIFDGPSAASPLIGVYAGTGSPGTIISSGGALTFSFTSDGSVVNSGWSATITCVPSCTGTPNGGNITNASFPCSPSGSVTLNVLNASTGCGITYQWQSGPSATGPWTNITGATNPTISVALSPTTFYRRLTICGAAQGPSDAIAATGYSPSCNLSSYSPSNITYNFETFVGTLLPTTDDVLYNSISLFTFPFCFSGGQFSGGYVASNSSFVFDAVPCFPNILTTTYAAPGVGTGWDITAAAPVNSTSIPRNAILGPWHDTNPSSGGTIRMGVLGTAPNRRFVVSFENIPMFSFSCSSLLFTGQIKLFETTNDIEIHIGNKPLCTSWNNGRAVLGLHNYNGTVYVPPVNMTAHNSPTQWTMTNTAYRFTSSCPAQSLCATPLPIGFSNLYGQNFGSINKVWWETTDEVAVKEFLVERSTDGQTFSEIGRVNSNHTPSKHAFDDNTFVTGIINYYRITALHFSGQRVQTSIYPIFSIEEKVLIAGLFPNPANNKLNININGGSTEDVDFMVYDQFGKLMFSEKKKIKPGLTTIELDIEQLAGGLYFIEVRSADNAVISKQKFSKL